ncbi:hypothetical protein GCM10009679_59560 [Saccharothrix algeriensis]|uniref:Uncharacterized protein n=1 Tax=Catellatospora bangladeshensis TaxID=310355 RepID=A0A8J3NM08_9ACTN|nr:hypothetical protein Cba03nite_44990 [Catellatospora bangladeshensis]
MGGLVTDLSDLPDDPAIVSGTPNDICRTPATAEKPNIARRTFAASRRSPPVPSHRQVMS